MKAVIKEFSDRISDIVAALRREFSSVRTNRPTPAMVEQIKVDVYGQMMTVRELASISIAPPREIFLQVWDKNIAGTLAKALEAANLGFSVTVDGNTIRAHLPELSRERRQELVRHIKRQAEQYRIQLRHARDEVNKKITAARERGEAGEDLAFSLKEEAQKETEKKNGEIDAALNAKVREIES